MSTVTRQRAAREKLLVELEWRRCAADPAYWMSRYVFIPSLREEAGGTGRERFHLFDYQERWLADAATNKFLITLKCRQLGATTLAMVLALHGLLFTRGGERVLVISKDQDSANNNLALLAQVYRWLPAWMRERGPTQKGDAATQMEWTHPDGSRSFIKSLPATKTVAAGFTPNKVIIDEADLSDYFSDVWQTVEPATMAAATNAASTGWVAWIISTARNPAGRYARMWRAGRAGRNRFKAQFESWKANRFLWTDGAPDPAKRAAKKAEAEAEAKVHEFYREYPETPEEAFSQSGHRWFTTIPAEDEVEEFPHRGRLKERTDEHGEKTLEFVPHPQGELRLAYLDVPAERFVLSVDPAHGRGADSTVGQVLAYDEDGEPYLAAYWESATMSQELAAGELGRLGRFFAGSWQREALLVCESTGGHAELLFHIWRQMGYGNLYTYTPVSKHRRRMDPAPGFNTAGTGGKRDLVLHKMQQLLPRLGNLYPLLRDELATFVVRKNGFVAAEDGCHDDHVLACAIGLWVLEERCAGAARVSTGEKRATEAVGAGSVAYIFTEAERIRTEQAKAWRKVERAHRRQSRRLTRQGR